MKVALPVFSLGNLSLARKVALIPALTLMLMGLMLAVAMQTGERNTSALRTLDHDVFEPLVRAQMLKDEITLLHARLFALLSLGNNETDRVAQKVNADALIAQVDATAANFDRFLVINAIVSAPVEGRLRQRFADYASRVRETASFAAYDASYGALLAGVTDDNFGHLLSELDALVQSLAQRRAALATDAVSDSLAAQRTLMALGLGAAMLAVLGSVIVGRGIARPVLRLTWAMNQLAGGDTDVAIPGTAHRDEVGAMAHAVEVFRDNLIARRLGEVALQRSHLELDAALNSMLQGMVVWDPEHRVQLVNGRYFTICGMPDGCILPGMTVEAFNATAVSYGLHPGEGLNEISAKLTTLLIAGRSMQLEVAMRPGLLVRLASEPMPNGGAVITFEDVTEKRRNEKQIAFMARHDALTSLPNRTLFQEHLEAAVAAAEVDNTFAVLGLDLDRFKAVNDTFGHAAGDELLRLVAGRLQHCVRDTDVVARLGGDEFAIVLAGKSGGVTPASLIAARMIEAISAPYRVQGHDVVIGCSIGIVLSQPGVAGAELLKRADVALYRAKEERGTFVFFEPGMDESSRNLRELEADLRIAVHQEDFELYYQPLYSLVEDRVTSFEALIRWNSPTRGRVSPDVFIPLAEQTGLIGAIGEWVLRTACAEAARWPEDVKVAVNLSPIQFRNKQLVAVISETLNETGLPAHQLCLEITETAMLQDTDAVITVLRGLHDLNVQISMGDFGTGYSSLGYLRRFPFDKIKIDRSFISDLRAVPNGDEQESSAESNSAAVILRTVVGLSRHLGMATTAEGVETAYQLARIRGEGCTEVQGYFLSPPRPAAEVAALIERLDTTMPAIVAGLDRLPGRGLPPDMPAYSSFRALNVSDPSLTVLSGKITPSAGYERTAAA